MSKLPQTTQLISAIVCSFCQLRIETFLAVSVLKGRAASPGWGVAMNTAMVSSQWHPIVIKQNPIIFNKSGCSKGVGVGRSGVE